MNEASQNNLIDLSEFYTEAEIEKADIAKLQSRLRGMKETFDEQIRYFEQKPPEEQKKIELGKQKYLQMARQEMDIIKQELAKRGLN